MALRHYCGTLALAFIATLAPASAAPQDDVLAADAALNHALLAHDAATVGTYITGDYTLTLGSGQLLDRATLLAFVASPSMKLTINQAHDERVRFYGETTAIVTGIVEEAGTMGGSAFDNQVPFTDTWVLQNGRWLQAAGHASSPLKAPKA